FAGIAGYDVGGTLHVVVNNLIGFTAEPRELHSSRFASDIARRLNIPIFHVNADDPESALRVARLAAEYRYTFSSDVVVDLVGFPRHGHSEVDDPPIPQPLLYRKIKDHPPAFQIYAQQSSLDAAPVVDRVRKQYQADLQRAASLKTKPALATPPEY